MTFFSLSCDVSFWPKCLLLERNAFLFLSTTWHQNGKVANSKYCYEPQEKQPTFDDWYVCITFRPYLYSLLNSIIFPNGRKLIENTNTKILQVYSLVVLYYLHKFPFHHTVTEIYIYFFGKWVILFQNGNLEVIENTACGFLKGTFLYLHGKNR